MPDTTIHSEKLDNQDDMISEVRDLSLNYVEIILVNIGENLIENKVTQQNL